MPTCPRAAALKTLGTKTEVKNRILLGVTPLEVESSDRWACSRRLWHRVGSRRYVVWHRWGTVAPDRTKDEPRLSYFPEPISPAAHPRGGTDRTSVRNDLPELAVGAPVGAFATDRPCATDVEVLSVVRGCRLLRGPWRGCTANPEGRGRLCVGEVFMGCGELGTPFRPSKLKRSATPVVLNIGFKVKGR